MGVRLTASNDSHGLDRTGRRIPSIARRLRGRLPKNVSRQLTKGVITRDVNALWAFYHEIHEGDVVVARRGTKRIILIGRVIGNAYYDETKGRERLGGKADRAYANFLPVAWDSKNIDFDRQVFSFYTIYEIPKEKLDELLEQHSAPKPQPESDEREPPPSETEFALEKYLEDFIVSNFDGIFKGQLCLYKDPDGNPAQQYPVLSKEGKISGRIDILAVDPATNDFVVIELKKGKESDPVRGTDSSIHGVGKRKPLRDDSICEGDHHLQGYRRTVGLCAASGRRPHKA